MWQQMNYYGMHVLQESMIKCMHGQPNIIIGSYIFWLNK